MRSIHLLGYALHFTYNIIMCLPLPRSEYKRTASMRENSHIGAHSQPGTCWGCPEFCVGEREGKGIEGKRVLINKLMGSSFNIRPKWLKCLKIHHQYQDHVWYTSFFSYFHSPTSSSSRWETDIWWFSQVADSILLFACAVLLLQR